MVRLKMYSAQLLKVICTGSANRNEAHEFPDSLPITGIGYPGCPGHFRNRITNCRTNGSPDVDQRDHALVKVKYSFCLISYSLSVLIESKPLNRDYCWNTPLKIKYNDLCKSTKKIICTIS